MITIEICHRSNFPAGCTYTVLNGSCNIKQSKIRFIVCSTVQTKQERLSRTPTVRLSGDVWATVKKFEQVLRGNGARGSQVRKFDQGWGGAGLWWGFLMWLRGPLPDRQTRLKTLPSCNYVCGW